MYLKVKIDGLPIPNSSLVKDPYKLIFRDCAIYFSIITVYQYSFILATQFFHDDQQIAFEYKTTHPKDHWTLLSRGLTLYSRGSGDLQKPPEFWDPTLLRAKSNTFGCFLQKNSEFSPQIIPF